MRPSATASSSLFQPAEAQCERQCHWRCQPVRHAARVARRLVSSSRTAAVTLRARVATAATADACDSAEAANAAVVQEFSIEHDLPVGRLVIRPVAADDVGPASVVLTRAFAGSLQGVPIQDSRKYCQHCLEQPPRGVLLVARLYPTDESLLPPGQDSRLVATTGLSFFRDTREEFPTLQPPDDAVYLSNMAVDVRLRRQGHARRMLAASEALCAALAFDAIYLHARLTDQPAQDLYNTSGYEVVDQDSFLVKLRGITPRALMRKSL